MANCCKHPAARLNDDGSVRVSLFTCRDRFCPLCAKGTARRTADRVEAVVGKWDAVRHLTLTLKANDKPLAEQIDHLLQSFRRMRQTKWWAARVRGGIGTVEVTHNTGTNQWHPHLHILLDGEYLPQSEVADLWHRTTGDSPIVHITMPASRGKCATYIAKYVTKPEDLSKLGRKPLLELATALCGRRTIITFGTAHGAGLPVPTTKPLNRASQHLCPIYAARRAFEKCEPFAYELAKLLRRALPVAYKLITSDYQPSPTPELENYEPPWPQISDLFRECESWHYNGSNRLKAAVEPPKTNTNPTPLLFT